MSVLRTSRLLRLLDCCGGTAFSRSSCLPARGLYTVAVLLRFARPRCARPGCARRGQKN